MVRSGTAGGESFFIVVLIIPFTASVGFSSTCLLITFGETAAAIGCLIAVTMEALRVRSSDEGDFSSDVELLEELECILRDPSVEDDAGDVLLNPAYPDSSSLLFEHLLESDCWRSESGFR